MTDFYEIDFLDVETAKSGDAITLRYGIGGVTQVHVVDGGFQDTGTRVLDHLRTHYGNPRRIERVVVSHPDGDHAGGLRSVLETLAVGELWMLRPWQYAGEIIHQFTNYNYVDSLRTRLRTIYPNLAALEDIAIARRIPIYEPFQGARIGAFTVMAPTKQRYLNLIISSEKTPESREQVKDEQFKLLRELLETAKKAVNFVKASWGAETFSTEETSAENEMSVIQYANLCGVSILLTADAGRSAMSEAASYAPYVGLTLPGIKKFQVPHHGSRRNVSTAMLDQWLGPRLAAKPMKGQETFAAIISSAKADVDHPRKSVVRALIHRGAKVLTTEGGSVRTSMNADERAGWGPAEALMYPDEQEE